MQPKPFLSRYPVIVSSINGWRSGYFTKFMGSAQTGPAGSGKRC